jgi:predicted nucleic acid-binding protein
VSRIAADFGMGAGEAETLALFLEGRGRSGAVATDNRQARRAASVHGIPVVGSPELVVSLFRGSRISKERARAALAALKRFGWFADALIDVAMEELEGR